MVPRVNLSIWRSFVTVICIFLLFESLVQRLNTPFRIGKSQDEVYLQNMENLDFQKQRLRGAKDCLLANPMKEIEKLRRDLGSMDLCPIYPDNLEGVVEMELEAMEWSTLSFKFKNVEDGGFYAPSDCISRHRVAIIIPYRDRENHLKVLLNHLHPILQRQNLEYGIYVIHQDDDYIFNRGMVKNIGFVEALLDRNWDCIVFHDVDLLPEDDRNLYTCSEQPKHLSVGVSTFNYKLPYMRLIGGVFEISVKDFKTANGFTNQCWGWGAEDDDLFGRMEAKNISVYRPDPQIAKFTMQKHRKDQRSSFSAEVYREGYKYYETDGLNNLQYIRRKVKKFQTFTMISVECIDFFPEGYDGDTDRNLIRPELVLGKYSGLVKH